jgi:hypothetical protein
LSADPEKEVIIRWDHNSEITAGMTVTVPSDPITADQIDYGKEMKDYDPGESDPACTPFLPKEATVEKDSRDIGQRSRVNPEASMAKVEEHKDSGEAAFGSCSYMGWNDPDADSVFDEYRKKKKPKEVQEPEHVEKKAEDSENRPKAEDVEEELKRIESGGSDSFGSRDTVGTIPSRTKDGGCKV